VTLPGEPDPTAVVPLGCPTWCLGAHRDGGEHFSANARLGNLLLEVLRYPGDEQVYVSLLEAADGGRYFTLPMMVVPSIAAAALRLTTPVEPT
jgi:hypothetical protein